METINLSRLASKLEAYRSCVKSNNVDWREQHEADILEMLENNLPSGSGLDSGVEFDWQNSTDVKLVFNFSFHHMNGNGYYEGWTQHVLTVTPSFSFGYKIHISGRNKNQIKEYLSDLFSEVFTINHNQLA